MNSARNRNPAAVASPGDGSSVFGELLSIGLSWLLHARRKMTPQQVVNLVLSVSIGVAAAAMFCAIAFFFWRDWVKH
jgi:hypothetical protein